MLMQHLSYIRTQLVTVAKRVKAKEVIAIPYFGRYTTYDKQSPNLTSPVGKTYMGKL